MINKRSFLFGFILFQVFLSSCNNPNSKNQEQSVLSGNINISADESFKPIIDAEMDTYNAIYDRANIKCNYKSESHVIKDLLNDSVEVIIIGRDIDSTERKYFYSKGIPVRSYKLCTDAIALVVHESFPDSLIRFDLLSEILLGNKNSWKDLNKSMPDSSIQIIMDRSNSSNLYSINNLLTIDLKKVNIRSTGSNKKVLNYVRLHRTSLGFVGASWINDLDDPEVRASLKGLKVLSVLKKDSLNVYRDFSPFQSQIGKNAYPLSRDIYIISQNKNKGPGTGFVSFALSERGQRIVLKSGLLPAKMPGREIEIK